MVPGQSKPSLMSVLASSKVANFPDKTLPENLAHWDRKFINSTTELNSTLSNSDVEFGIWMSNLNSRIPHPNSKIRQSRI